MSEKLCTLRTKGGGGGRYTETSLWTNSAPTSSFASQTVTLSDSIDKYKYIMFKYSPSTSTVSSVIQKAIYSVEDVKKSTSSSNTPYVTNGSQTSYQMVRTILYATSTTLTFGSAYKVAQSGSDNTTCIPLEILGLNELAHGKRESSLGTLPYQTSSNLKVTLGFKPKALQVFIRGNDTNTITLQYDESISTTKYVRNYTASTPQSGWQTIGSTANQRRLWSIDDDGFTLTPNTDTSSPTIYYSAVGDV